MSASAEPVIAARAVTRMYGPFMALNSVSLEIEGGIVGLLGPNGAGKSTFLKLVTGQLRPSGGALTVFGVTPFDTPAIMRRIGVVPEIETFYEDMTGRQFVTWLTRLHGIAPDEAAARAEQALAEVGLAEHADKRIERYSKGMRQKTKLAQALAHEPDLLILDEPLTGADPMSRHDIIETIKKRAGVGADGGGAAVVMSSHVLHEVEELTRDIILINRGRILAEGNIDALRELIDDQPRRVVLTCDRPRELGALLVREPAVSGVAFLPEGGVEVRTATAETLYELLPPVAEAAGTTLTSLTSPDDDMENIFTVLLEGR